MGLLSSDLQRIKDNVKKMASQNAPQEDIDGYISSEGTSVKEVRNFQGIQKKSLVGSEQVESDIASRGKAQSFGQTMGNIWEQGQEGAEYARQHPLKAIAREAFNPMHRLKQAGKMVGNVGAYVAPRIMGGVSNPLMEMQQGGNAPQIFEGFRQGIAGERQGNLGDPIAKTLYGSKFANRNPELAAGLVVGGKLGGEVAVYTGVAKGLSTLNKMRPRIHTQGQKGWFVKRAKNVHKAYTTEKANLSGQYDAGWKSSATKIVPKNEVDDALTALNKAAKKKPLAELAGKKQYTVEDLNKARKGIDRMINDGSYVKLAKGKDPAILQQELINARTMLKEQALKYSTEGTRKAIARIDPKWKALETQGKELDKMVYDVNKQTFKTSGIKRRYGAKGDEGVHKGTKEALGFSKPLRGEIKSLEKFTTREGQKNIAKMATPYAAGLGGVGAAALWLKKTFGG